MGRQAHKEAVLMVTTATDLTREHYQRPGVRNVILRYCAPESGMRALNADEHWYTGGHDPATVVLRGPADYDDSIKRGKTLYATLDILEPSVFGQATRWDEARKAPEKPIGDFSNCLAFTLSTDIDGIGDISKDLSVKEAVEAAGQFHVDYLRERGITNNVYCLYSGGGIYVHLHHALFAVDVGNTDLAPEEIKRQYQIVTKAYNALIGDISQAFFRKYPEYIGKVKFDQLNNQKRTFKTILSLHKRLPYAVIPLDPKAIKIDFSRASLPISDEVLAECAAWYKSYDLSEKEALVSLLKDKIDEIKQIIRDRPTAEDSTISRLPEPLDRATFAPCIKNIIDKAEDHEGKHRALGILATYLFQMGWNEDAAFDLWAEVANRCRVELRIFDTTFGIVSCPLCSTIQTDTGGYPHLNLFQMGFCVPDENCKGCQWPGDYHLLLALEHYSGQAGQEPAGGDPSIRPVSLEDEDGRVGIGPKGTVCKVAELTHPKSGEIKKFLEWVSDCALHIETETRSKDETEFIFVGTGATDKRPVRFTLPAGALAEPKKFKAALLNAFGAKNRIGALNFEMVQEISLNPRLMQRVEVPVWDGNTPLLPGVGLAGNVEFRLSPKIPASVHDGDLQAAGDVLKKLLRVHRFAPLVVAAIMGAPAVARWHKGDRFGLGLWGQTGTLKTSIVLAAMGIYGPGYLDAPRLKAGKGGATLVAAMEIFAAAGFLPQLYDNVKNVDAKDSQTYIAAMHAVLEGEEKARGKKDGGLRESREFLCTPIVTGEVRPQEASTSARILNLNWSQPDANLLADVQKNAAMLPVIGYQWLRFLAETDCVLGKDFEAFRSKKMEEFLKLKYVNPGRLATIHSLLVSVWDLLENSPMGPVFTEAHERFKTALDVATAAQGQAVAEETEIERFLSGLEELRAGNPGLIQSRDGKRTIAGSIIGKEMELGLFLLPTETLNELMKIKAFNQQPTIDSITQALNERGLLVPGESGKLQNRQRINGTRVYGWYIRGVPPKRGTEGDTKGDAKNDNSGQFVPSVPHVPAENKREKFLDQNSKDITPKDSHINTGDKGDIGDSRERDRDIDIDFDDKKVGKSVPFSVPSETDKGDTISSECGNKAIPDGEESSTPVPTGKSRSPESKQTQDCGNCQVAIRGDKSAIKCDHCSYLAGKEVARA